MINPELDRLSRARYVSVTTFGKDGAPVPTPVRVVSEGGYLQVLSKASAGEVRRLRDDARVTVAPCDARGNLQGDPVAGRAAVIDDPDLVDRVKHMMARRYGFAARLLQQADRLRGRPDDVALAIEVGRA